MDLLQVSLRLEVILKWINVLTHQGQGHGHNTQTEVREGEVPDEDIPGCPHLRGAENGGQDQEVAQTPDCHKSRKTL